MTINESKRPEPSRLLWERPVTTPELLSEIKSRLARVNGQRLRSVVLYGSEACGQARPDSDVDALLLDDPVNYGRDLGKNLAALYPLALAAS